MKRDKARQDALGADTRNSFNALDANRRKGVAQDFVKRVLDAFEAEKMTPDEWEAADLMYACGLIAGGMYSAALHYTNRALTPLDERSPSQPGAAFTPTLADLQHAHSEVSKLQPIDR